MNTWHTSPKKWINKSFPAYVDKEFRSRSLSHQIQISNFSNSSHLIPPNPAGFHETVEPGSKILTTISTRVLPKMLEFLTKKTLAPVERSKKKSIAYEEDQVAVQVFPGELSF